MGRRQWLRLGSAIFKLPRAPPDIHQPDRVLVWFHLGPGPMTHPSADAAFERRIDLCDEGAAQCVGSFYGSRWRRACHS